MIHRLQTEFIPVSGNTAELQFRRTPAAAWFMQMANQADWRSQPGNTTQGFYVAAADGTCYGWMNERDLPKLQALMDRGLEQFRAHPPAAVAIPDTDLAARFAAAPDPSTSVVRVFTRIRPVPAGADPINNGVGRDQMWIFAEDVRDLLEASESADEFEMPRALATRMVRFHLIDNVRGEPDMWKPDQVRKAAFTVRIAARAPGRRDFTFSGEFAQGLPDDSRGQEGTIRGEFSVDTETRKVTRFRAYSEGKAWGCSEYTPEEPEGRFPLIIAMVETDDAIARAVPPQAVWMGREYLSPHL